MVAPNCEAVSDAAPQEKTVEQKKEMLTVLMTDGKRDFVSGSFSSACEKLSEAVALSVEIHGDFAAESFEPHFYYGRAMLELGRAQDDVLDNAMKDLPVPDELDESADEERYGNPENLTEEEKMDIRAKVGDALEQANSGESTTENPVVEPEVTEKPAVDAETTVEADSTTESAKEPAAEEAKTVESAEADSTEDSAETQPPAEVNLPSEEAQPAEEDGAEDMEGDEAPEGEAEEGEGEEEEATEAQIAWEVLEVARKICEAQEQNKEWELKKSDVLLELSDCSITNEKYQEAIDDLNACLEIQKKHLEESDRRFAQTYLGMARAYRLNDDFDNAAKFYKQTKVSIVSKITSLEAMEQKDGEVEEEIKELKMIVEDLDLKIEDAIESGKQTEENLNKIREQMGLKSTSNVLCEKTSEPAGDITNLIRKPAKRPAETEVAPEDPKRAKEDTAAGDASNATA